MDVRTCQGARWSGRGNCCFSWRKNKPSTNNSIPPAPLNHLADSSWQVCLAGGLPPCARLPSTPGLTESSVPGPPPLHKWAPGSHHPCFSCFHHCSPRLGHSLDPGSPVLLGPLWRQPSCPHSRDPGGSAASLPGSLKGLRRSPGLATTPYRGPSTLLCLVKLKKAAETKIMPEGHPGQSQSPACS